MSGLLDLYADDLDKSYQSRLKNPPPPTETDFSTWSFLKAGASGVPVGAAQGVASATDVYRMSPVGSTADVFTNSAELANLPEVNDPISFAKTKGKGSVEAPGDAIRRKASSLAPDPTTAHAADQVFHGATRVITKAIAGVVAAGPVRGAALVGLEEGNTTAQDLIAKGVDANSAAKAGAVQGGMTALGIILPVSGAAVKGGMLAKGAATAGLVAAGGPGAFMAQEFTIREILNSAGAHDEAASHDPTDPLGLAMSVLLPGVFAGASLRGAAKRIKSIEAGGVKLDAMSVPERKALKYNNAALDEYANRAAIANGVPPEILLAVKNAGEKSNSDQTSPAGAKGVMQFMPATAKEVGIKDLTDPVESIDGAARYLKKLHGAYGSWDAAVAHYNGGGTQAVLVRGGGKPSFKETAKYLERVQAYVKKMGAESVVQKSPEVVDAARVKLLDEVSARSLPDHPEAYSRLAEVEQDIDAGRVVNASLTPTIELPEFKAWFGDSKVIDAEGKPMVVYHGTKGEFDSFSEEMLAKNSTHETAKLGFWFGKDSNVANFWAGLNAEYESGGNVLPVFLNIKNPLKTSANEIRQAIESEKWTRIDGLVAMLKEDAEKGGHDGIQFIGDGKHPQWGADTFVAFSKNQIKSAIGNSGRFDPNSGSLTDQKQPLAGIQPARSAIKSGVYLQSVFEKYGGKGDIDESLDIAAKSHAFADMVEADGWQVAGRGHKYVTLTKDFGQDADGYPQKAIVKVRVSDHSNVNRSIHFGEHDINLAPDDGYARDTFSDALKKLRMARVDDDMNTVFDAQPVNETGVQSAQSAIDLEAWIAARKPDADTGIPDAEAGKGSPFVSWLRNKGGIAVSQMRDIAGDKGIRGNYAGIFSKRGRNIDQLAQEAVEDGFLRPADLEAAGDVGGTGAFTQLVERTIRGEKLLIADQALEARQVEGLRRQELEGIEQMESELRTLGVDPSPLQGNGKAMAEYLAENRAALVNRTLQSIETETQAIRNANGESFGLPREQFDAQSRIALAMKIDEAGVERAAMNAADDVDFLNQIEDILGHAPTSTKADAGFQSLEGNAGVSAGARAIDDANPAARDTAPASTASANGDAAFVAAQVKQLLDESPDLKVTLPGQDTPVTLAKALEQAQREADEIRLDADLVKAAAECALMNAL